MEREAEAEEMGKEMDKTRKGKAVARTAVWGALCEVGLTCR
jgi:hypothetical protein